MIWAALVGFCHVAQAADVVLSWDPVDFEAVFSDPEQSGYRLYKSLDDGVTKEQIGAVGMDETSYRYTENTPGHYCYFATSFNQSGESAFSEPACGYIADEAPPVQVGLKVLIQKLISALQEFLNTLG